MPQPLTGPVLSLVVPAYNESLNLPTLRERVATALGDLRWELIVVDDHSSDGTFEVLSRMAASDPRVRGVRLSRNSGSHTAILAGLDEARGECTAVLAADLQDPPTVLTEMLARWRAGAQIVWAVRAGREGESGSTRAGSRLYWTLMRRFVGLTQLPPAGSDFFLIDRVVVAALRQFPERNVSLFALLSWIGFRQESVTYVKQARLHGHSGWSLEKKLKLAVDSITSFTYRPIRMISYLGVLTFCVGLAFGVVVVVHAVRGGTPMGWASLMVAVLILGGVQTLTLGVLGEYLWRALDEARRRPLYLVEHRAGESPKDPGAAPGA